MTKLKDTITKAVSKKMADLRNEINKSAETLAVAECSFEKCKNEKKKFLEQVYKVNTILCQKDSTSNNCDLARKVKSVLDLMKKNKLTVTEMRKKLDFLN